MKRTRLISHPVLHYLALVFAAIGVTYFAPEVFVTLFFITTLVVYARSEDEPFWLAFYLVLVDGFLGFFGGYSATFSAIPGLPEIEVSQFYILLATIKAIRTADAPKPFYQLPLAIVMVYLVFLVLQGGAIGLDPAMNVKFRVFKLLTPFLLFYALPRLLRRQEDFAVGFQYLFIVAIAAFGAQVLTIATFKTPPMYLGLEDDTGYFAMDIAREITYRGFYNPAIVLITTFGAAFFLARQSPPFNPAVLYVVLTVNFLNAFLSATRGWILSFSLFLLLFFLYISWGHFKRIMALAALATLLVLGTLSVPVIGVQVQNSLERLQTLDRLRDGDITAGGTLLRLSRRGPRVMGKWRESPLTGWGFSDTFFDYRDGHVGNQNILMHAGVLGYLILMGFLSYFGVKLGALNARLPAKHPDKGALLVFGMFLVAWFLLHSTTGQQFSYYLNPGEGMIQALFFSWGACVYQALSKAAERRPEAVVLWKQARRSAIFTSDKKRSKGPAQKLINHDSSRPSK